MIVDEEFPFIFKIGYSFFNTFFSHYYTSINMLLRRIKNHSLEWFFIEVVRV